MPQTTPVIALPSDDLFAPQPTSSAQLPDPRMLVENLSRSAIEILAGVRESSRSRGGSTKTSTATC
jgi:hypothetical protein